MGANGTPIGFQDARARRQTSIGEYVHRVGRYRETVTRLTVAIVQGHCIAGNPVDPAQAVRDAREQAKDLDAFFAECDALVTQAMKSGGMDCVEPFPKYVTPGAAETATEQSAS